MIFQIFNLWGENPEGLRMVEFPFTTQQLHHLPNGATPIEQIDGSLRSLVQSSYARYLQHYKARIDEATALCCSVICSLPFSIFFSRVVLPETPAPWFLTLYSLYNYARRALHTSGMLWRRMRSSALLIANNHIFLYCLWLSLYSQTAWNCFKAGSHMCLWCWHNSAIFGGELT
jgi:hypothetical protein